jgi:hypothetical protein
MFMLKVVRLGVVKPSVIVSVVTASYFMEKVRFKMH